MRESLAGIADSIYRTATADPHRSAIVLTDRTLDYARLISLLRDTVTELRPVMRPRGRVLVSSTDPELVLIGCIAVWSLGCSAVVVPARSTADEVADLAALAAPMAELRFAASRPRAEERRGRGDGADDAPIGEDPEALFLRTSGSTGRPKGVSVGARARYRCVTAVAGAYGMSRRRALMISTPVTHSAGLTFASAQLYAGGTLIVAEAFDGPRLVELLRRAPVATMLTVPMLLDRMLSEPSRDVAPERVVSMGSPLTSQQRERLSGLWPDVELTEYYGCSEHPHIAWSGGASTGPSSLRLFAGVEARIVSPDGRCLDDGMVGHLQVRGPFSMRGYVDEDGSLVPAPEWLSPGDLAVKTGNEISLRGRADDVVVIGGVNVRPREVELSLLKEPGVDECRVIAIPDERYGHQLVAVVVVTPDTRLTSRELGAIVSSRLGPAKRPRQILIVDELPRDSMGKIRNASLRVLAEGAVARSSS